MSEKSKLKANLTREIEHRFRQKIRQLEVENQKLRDKTREDIEEINNLTNSNLELKSQLEELADWNARLMDFMDMSEDKRQEYFDHIKQSKESADKFNAIYSLINKFI